LVKRAHTDFLFPQMTLPDFEIRDWLPGFIDYVFLAFTNATAFSPTDTMPLTQCAKLMMMAEAMISLLTIALVAAPALTYWLSGLLRAHGRQPWVGKGCPREIRPGLYLRAVGFVAGQNRLRVVRHEYPDPGLGIKPGQTKLRAASFVSPEI
jgi:hypothetical protein